MLPIRAVAIPTKVAEEVRKTRRAPQYGHPVHEEIATGYGPCRHCLRDFVVGVDKRILFTYDPFFGMDVRPSPGPVFIHSNPCERYNETGGFPEDIRSHRLTIVAYGDERKAIFEVQASDGNLDSVIEQAFQNPAVRYLHVRDTEAGCYDFRIEPESKDQGATPKKEFRC
ncbi:MAG: DUF1203 domain-containing protein [Candidatus Acidiferrales bacterium]